MSANPAPFHFQLFTQASNDRHVGLLYLILILIFFLAINFPNFSRRPVFNENTKRLGEFPFLFECTLRAPLSGDCPETAKFVASFHRDGFIFRETELSRTAHGKRVWTSYCDQAVKRCI